MERINDLLISAENLWEELDDTARNLEYIVEAARRSAQALNEACDKINENAELQLLEARDRGIKPGDTVFGEAT